MCLKLHKIINRSSKLFQPIIAVQKNLQAKNNDVTSKSQKLMLDAGIIKQANPGNFHFLPLGIRAFEKLTRIIDDEMQFIDGQKVIFPTLIDTKLWKLTGRIISGVETELFTLKDRHNASYILSPTHEESVADLLAVVSPRSYKYYPLKIYQITSKYRDEMKPRFGLMRGRQFFMKDLYSFDLDVESAKQSYKDVCDAYDRIFKKIGVNYVKVLATTGNMGGSISHEYHFPSEIGEDKILFCTDCDYKANVELVGQEKCPNCLSTNVKVSNGIEVAHTFLLGDKYTKPLKATYLAQNGKPEVLQMGSYGIGVSRILAAAVEVLSTEQEIRWPNVLAPFSAIIIGPKDGSKEEQGTEGLPERIYTLLNSQQGLQNNILFDDRSNMTIGRRILDAKRTGYPFIIIVGLKAMENPPLYEVIDVVHNKQTYLSEEQVLHLLKETFVIQMNK